jgi:hypothetical protein
MLEQTLDRIATEIESEIRANLERYNRNASGNASRSLRHEITPTNLGQKVTIYGASYLCQLEYGRGATKGGGGQKFTVQMIADWIVAKGLTYDIPLQSLAYLIWKKINRVGYEGTKGVITDAINPIKINAYLKQLGGEVTKSLVKDLKNALST